MISERKRQVEELYHATLKREPGERVAFLAQTDPGLRSEVESLLAQRGAGSSQLAPGTQLGPYQIEGSLGAGGMGEVYKARDTRLDRTVAIKTSQQRFDDRFRIDTFDPAIGDRMGVGHAVSYLASRKIEGFPQDLNKALFWATVAVEKVEKGTGMQL